MFVFGVLNASPDSLHAESIVASPAAAKARADWLLAVGADGLDIGGQGSTDAASVVSWSTEWARLAELLPVLAEHGVPLSVDTWRPEVARKALAAGATMINAADGMQGQAMWEVAAEHGVDVVVPFLSGPNPRQMRPVARDPLDAIAEFFAARLQQADQFGMRERCILDPGTGFAPTNWPWKERYHYQKRVYSGLDELRRFGRPLYIALPWKVTPQHDELMEIVLRQDPEYGRTHHPDRVRARQKSIAASN